MNNAEHDEFYVGYADRAPVKLARRTRFTAMALIAGLAVVAGVLAGLQTPAEPGVYEFGVEKPWEGVLHGGSISWLHVGSAGAATNYFLVGSGKFGLPEWARGHDGERVRFTGSLIQKGSMALIEMNDRASFSALGKADASEAAKSLGKMRISGELVDTKCYGGVMRPAAGKVHRGCAVRCLSGGVPPGLLLRDASGEGRVVLINNPSGRPLRFDPQWAARTVTGEGILKELDGALVLETDELRLE
jgi:hypothetical protein